MLKKPFIYFNILYYYFLFQVILSEDKDIDTNKYLNGDTSSSVSYPFNLDLELVLGKMPQKVNVH